MHIYIYIYIMYTFICPVRGWWMGVCVEACVGSRKTPGNATRNPTTQNNAKQHFRKSPGNKITRLRA